MTTTPDPRELLLTDVDAFNNWRLSQPDAELDLSEADLRGADLSKAMLAGAKLDHARLDDASLMGAVLAGASCVGTSFRRADLRRANFSFVELFSADLTSTALGSALAQAANVEDACFVAARANEANFKESRLVDVEITDCDFRGAQLKRTALEDAELDLPPTLEDEDEGVAFWSRFRAEPLAVREGLALFTGMIFIASGQHADLAPSLSAVVSTLEFDQASFNALMPTGEIDLDAMTIAPPSSDWARRVWLALMCGVASGAPIEPTELQVIGHFGEQFGFTERAMARIMSAELGLEISAS